MFIGDLAREVGRSTDTLKRWEVDGLLVALCYDRGRRVYDSRHLTRARELAEIGIQAQFVAKKMLHAIDQSEPVSTDALKLMRWHGADS